MMSIYKKKKTHAKQSSWKPQYCQHPLWNASLILESDCAQYCEKPTLQYMIAMIKTRLLQSIAMVWTCEWDFTQRQLIINAFDFNLPASMCYQLIMESENSFRRSLVLLLEYLLERLCTDATAPNLSSVPFPSSPFLLTTPPYSENVLLPTLIFFIPSKNRFLNMFFNRPLIGNRWGR